MKTALVVVLTVITSLLLLDFKLVKENHKTLVSNLPIYKPVITSELTKNIEYDFAKASIRSNNFDNLNKLAKFLISKKYPLALRGYADTIGGFKANWKLSDERAILVKNYLVKMGVSDKNIVTTPFGSTKPIASNKTVLGRQRNRRVEITISQ